MSNWDKFMTPIEARQGYVPNDISQPSALKPNPSMTAGGTNITDFELQQIKERCDAPKNNHN